VAEEMQRDKGYGKKYLDERRKLKQDRQGVHDGIMKEQSMQIQLRENEVDIRVDADLGDRREGRRISALEVIIREI